MVLKLGFLKAAYIYIYIYTVIQCTDGWVLLTLEKVKKVLSFRGPTQLEHNAIEIQYNSKQQMAHAGVNLTAFCNGKLYQDK